RSAARTGYGGNLNSFALVPSNGATTRKRTSHSRERTGGSYTALIACRSAHEHHPPVLAACLHAALSAPGWLPHLLECAMESNRAWPAQWGSLDVTLQKSFRR